MINLGIVSLYGGRQSNVKKKSKDLKSQAEFKAPYIESDKLVKQASKSKVQKQPPGSKPKERPSKKGQQISKLKEQSSKL